MNKYTLPLFEDYFYHIYNQGNNGETLFYKPENYEYFLRKFENYLSDFIELYSYCLMSNHFHFLIRIKNWKEIEPNLKNHTGLEKFIQKSGHKTEVVVSEQFRRFFMAYSKAINKQERRTGSLFRKYHKRKLIDIEKYFQSTVVYIHQNPIHHKLFNDFRNYPWSSYNKIIDEKPSLLMKNEVLAYFENIENFKYVHEHWNSNYDEIEE